MNTIVKIRIILTFVLGIHIAVANGQYGGLHQTTNATESLQAAQDFLAQNEPYRALQQLKHTVKIKKNFAIAHRIMGSLQLYLGYYEDSAKSFETSFDLDDKLSRAAFFECGEAYLKNEEPTLAMHYYSRYKEMKGKRYANATKEKAMEYEYDKLLPLREANCAYIMQLDTAYNTLRVRNMGKNINSKYDDYLPSITSDGEYLLFTRNDKNKDENILLSSNRKGKWSNAAPVGGILNTNKQEGMAKFEAHGNTFYFTACRQDGETVGCDIYRAQFQDKKVKVISPLDGRLNSYFWDSQPSITCDGTIMYFASTREGGYGGSDIWQSTMDSNGDWGAPVNMGPDINTKGDEEAPFIATDGTSLYFTSNGHEGQGNGDIFVSWFEDKQWSYPENLGYPINSPTKEIGFYIKGDGKTAYFSSARKGGEGKLDIYEVELPRLLRPNPMVQVELFVIDQETGESVPSTVRFGHEGRTWDVETDDKGWIFHCLAGDKSYSFQIDHPDYRQLIDAVYIDTQDNTDNQQITLELKTPNEFTSKGGERVTKKMIQIYFDFDSDAITKADAERLKKLSQLINDYGDWRIQVTGYADNVGSEIYNKALSEKRAQAVVDFLSARTTLSIRKDINIVGKGATDDNGNDLDEEARRKSRRVDILLVR